MATKKEEVKDLIPLLKKETAPVVKLAENLQVMDEESKTKAATMLNNLKDVQKRVVSYKEAKTKPLNQALKVIRDETREIEGALTTAIETTRSKLNAYQTEQKRIADKKAEDIAARVGEGKGKFTAETAVRKIDELDKPSQSVATGAGEVKFRNVKKLVITDRQLMLRWLAENKPDMLEVSERAVLDLLKVNMPVLGAHIEEVQEAASY